MRKNTFTRPTGAAVLALGVFLTTACGSSDTGAASSAVSSTKHNNADVSFASDMLQHHAQALAMVDLTRGRTLGPEVKALTEQIQAAQTPEIETFTKWLTAWGEKVPETVRDHANADHDMGSMDMGSDSDMPGMMSSKEMEDLKDASDSEFSNMWLTMMIKHHEGAVEMAKTETEKGRYKPALDLAENISTSQSKEIDIMKGLVS